MSTVRQAVLLSVAAACWLAFAAPNAAAMTFTVNSTGDTGDETPGNNMCESTAPGPDCTLRAALSEAEDDALSTADTIDFHPDLIGQTITLNEGLPAMVEKVDINGCSAAPDTAGPCVGLAGGSGGFTAISLSGGANVGTSIRGLAFTGFSQAIFYGSDGDDLIVKNNYFGLTVTGADGAANATALSLIGDDSVVGGDAGATGTSPADRNVFAGNGTGIQLFADSDSHQIEGNYFGVRADGTTADGNSEAIEIVGNGTDTPSGNTIGGNVGTTGGTCDEECNVIANSTGIGIDLNGDGGGESPAGATTIYSNFIGMDEDGVSDDGNGDVGVRVGAADNVIVGSTDTAHEANYISGNEGGGVSATVGATGLFVHGNRVGVGSDNTTTVANAGTALDIGADGADLQNMIIWGNGTTSTRAVLFSGDSSSLTGSLIGVSGGGLLKEFTGPTVEITGDGNTVGTASVGNVISGANPALATNPGVLISNGDSNTVRANFIGAGAPSSTQNGGPGIRITSVSGGNSTGNVIGGDAINQANTLQWNGTDAIEILGAASTGNVVARNTASNNGSTANADLFIDLGGDGIGNPGVNGDINPPSQLRVNETRSAGLAEPGATVRLFRRTSAAFLPQVGNELATVTADSRGLWTVTAYSEPLTVGQIVASTQTTASDGTSEVASTSGAGTTIDNTPPSVQLDSGPNGPTNDATPTFGLAEQGADFVTFVCAVDGGAYVDCGGGTTGSITTPALSDGAHSVTVSGVDLGGNVDATPDTRAFTIDTQAPETSITAGPRKRVRSKKRRKRVSFSFTSSEPGSGGFQCQIDSQAFVACTSPFARRLKRGRHTFRVRAFDAAPNPDPTLATKTFRIVRPRRG